MNRLPIEKRVQIINPLAEGMSMHAVSLHFMHYNVARIHKSLRVTPVMATGISDRVWTIEEICNPVAAPEAKKRGAFKKREAQISN
jgi:hypothetical protein